MLRLTRWQWIVLGIPVIAVIGFLLVAAGLQIQAWGVSWIWAAVILMFGGWRWLLVRWTQPATQQLEQVLAAVTEDLQAEIANGLTVTSTPVNSQQLETALQAILQATREDPPIWDDWPTFWQRCQAVMTTIADAYHPEVKYPLLNIYIPQAYGLLRGTVDDMDRTLEKLAPVLNQVTVGQAYQAYEIYRQLEPSVRKLWRIWNWAQWLLNPAAAAARTVSQRSSNQAQQQLLVNLSQLLRETALRNLAQRAALLYGGSPLPSPVLAPEAPLPEAKTATLQEILDQVEPVATLTQKPINLLLVGRTGAGKSSLINTLFQAELATVDLLPNTDAIHTYHWQAPTGESLTLMDSPGYEQIARSDLRSQVLDYATKADLLLLVTPALDPALQMDADFLKTVSHDVPDLPILIAVTQVDKLRPVKEWSPPYDWQRGNRPKEKAIREATLYRQERLGQYCHAINGHADGNYEAGDLFQCILPIVTQAKAASRTAWNTDALALCLLATLKGAQQVRLARFLRSRSARATATAKLIDRYALQMTTTQGLTSLVKSPILRYLSMLMTGSELMASVLMEKIPVEQAPVVIGKLQLAYDLFSLLNSDLERNLSFDLLAVWPLLLDDNSPPEKSAWALGHSLVEYWLQDLTASQLKDRYQGYLPANGSNHTCSPLHPPVIP
jgi:predicted GTPase